LALRASATASAQALFGEQVLPVCAPGLLRDRARPLAKPADLARHVLLHLDDAHIFNPYLDWKVWLEALGLPGLQSKGALYFSHYDQLIQSAVEGQGVALGRTPLLSRHLRSGRLVAPFESGQGRNTTTESSRAYFILTASGAASRPEVQHFIDWLMAQARSEDAPRVQK
jgi:LysR family glycine cleavage system transcriptional activator